MTVKAGIMHHHDGHGLNENLLIRVDGRDFERGGGASHNYSIDVVDRIDIVDKIDNTTIDDCRIVWADVAIIQFQQGPRDDPKSKLGITDAALLAVVIDRYLAFQEGPYRCRENALVITKLQEALHWMKHRADDRANRGVLGKSEK